MSNVYKVWNDDEEDDTYEIKALDPWMAARDFCEHQYFECDGSEWMHKKDLIVCVNTGKRVIRYRMAIEFVPEFYVEEILNS